MEEFQVVGGLEDGIREAFNAEEEQERDLGHVSEVRMVNRASIKIGV